jgi:hypothetical protein
MTPQPEPDGRGRPPLPPGAGAESHIHLRVQRRRKAAYVQAANRRRDTLAAWCFRALDAAADYTPD